MKTNCPPHKPFYDYVTGGSRCKKCGTLLDDFGNEYQIINNATYPCPKCIEKDKQITQLQSTIDEKNKEIERLKGLIEDAHNSGWRRGYSLHTEIGESLQQFKSDNNI